MFDDVYITDVLEKRPSKRGDAEARMEALLTLSNTMSERPEEVLPQFVDLVMQLAGGVSAGISLYEEHPEPGVFRWRYLQGSLSPLEGAVVPRDNSPCGVPLDQHRSVLAAHPERIFEWITEQNIVVPEALMVPLYVGSDQPFGTLWIVAPREGHFDRSDEQMVRELAQFISNALQVLARESRLKDELDEQEILAREMSHRLKNLFAMTDGMIHMTARNAEDPEEMAEALSGRLRALATAHGLLQRRVRALGTGRTTNLHDLVESIVAVHDGDIEERSPRFRFSGPEVKCGDHAINGIALLIHELATNAAKYGALSEQSGGVSITWHVADDRLHLTWQEKGGPPLAEAPASSGFGTTLMTRTIEHQLHGELCFDWRPAGLVVEICIPTDTLTR